MDERAPESKACTRHAKQGSDPPKGSNNDTRLPHKTRTAPKPGRLHRRERTSARELSTTSFPARPEASIKNRRARNLCNMDAQDLNQILFEPFKNRLLCLGTEIQFWEWNVKNYQETKMSREKDAARRRRQGTEIISSRGRDAMRKRCQKLEVPRERDAK